MSRIGSKGGVRVRVAAAAARLMAEDGIDDFALAKRKAARQLGVEERGFLPGNDEIEAELRAYRSLYQSQDHAENIDTLRRMALGAMQTLERFRPYLTGAVLKGIAGPHAPIELQLFPDNAKDVELFFLERNIRCMAHQAKRFAGDRAHAVTVLKVDWNGAELRLSVLDPRDERLALKSSLAGKTLERAGIRELAELIRANDDAAQA